MLLNFLWTFIIFFVALGMLITVHECGHFLTARFFGIKVERVSIGFGPILWKWYDSNNTKYVVSMILVGGYVKLFNTDVHRVIGSCEEDAFDKKDIWKRVIVIVSGSIFNFIFSFLLYVLIYSISAPICKPMINNIIPNSIIAQAQVPSGIEIVSVNNVHTHNWEEVRFQILNSIEKERIIFSTKSIDNRNFHTYIVPFSKNLFNTYLKTQDPIVALGIFPDNFEISLILAKIKPNSIAESSGLKIGDKILKINDQPMFDWKSFIEYIKNNPEKNYMISVERQRKILYCHMILDRKILVDSNILIEEIIGIFPKIIIHSKKYYTVCYRELNNIICQACNKVWELIYLTVNTLIKCISGDVKATNVGGFIAIAQGARDAAHFGFIYYLMFLSIISVNLGIINLLPLPMLDGGHLFFLVLEKIKGKPVSQKIQDFGNGIGFFLLMLIMCLAFFNDLSKLW